MATDIDTVDESGNIGIALGEGIDVRIIETYLDGTVINIAGSPRVIQVQGSSMFEKVLAADPTNSTGRRILLTVEELKAVKSSATFSVLDTSDNTAPVALWQGTIYRR